MRLDSASKALLPRSSWNESIHITCFKCPRVSFHVNPRGVAIPRLVRPNNSSTSLVEIKSTQTSQISIASARSTVEALAATYERWSLFVRSLQ